MKPAEPWNTTSGERASMLWIDDVPRTHLASGWCSCQRNAAVLRTGEVAPGRSQSLSCTDCPSAHLAPRDADVVLPRKQRRYRSDGSESIERDRYRGMY